MATGAALTESHRLAQIGVQAATIRQLLQVWPAFSIDNVDGSWASIEGALLALITVQGQESAAVAASYFTRFRRGEGIPGTFPAVLADPPAVEAVTGSLRFVGPFGAKKLIAAGRTDVVATTFTKVAGDAGRHVLNQGRQTLLASVRADPKALGWIRVAGGKACSFCAMLCSRGPVYSGHGGITFAAHASCACTAQPVYTKDQPWPGRAEEWARQWEKTTTGLSGQEARIAFRQAIEGRST